MRRWAGIAVLAAVCLSGAALSQTSPDAGLITALSQHRFADASQIAESELKSHPSDVRLWTLRGMALDGLGQTAASLESYEKALRFNSRYIPALKAAAQLTYQHHDARVRAYLNRLLALKPDEAAAHAMTGVLDYEAHDCAGAITEFERSAQLVTGSEAAVTEYADCLLKEHRIADATALLKQAQSVRPESRNLRYDLAMAQLEGGDRAEALATLQSGTTDPGILSLRASIEVEAGDLDAAFRDLRTAAEMNPLEERNYLDMALLCLDHNEEQRAVDVLTVALEHLPKDATLYAIRGIANAELSRYDDAQRDFTQAHVLDPQGKFGKVAPTVLDIEKNSPDKAKELLRAQLKRDPADPVANTLLARLLIDAGALPATPDYAEAKAAIERALKADPNAVEALVLKGQMELDEDDPIAASKALERANQLDPNNRTALNQMLLAYRKLGRKDDAMRVVEQLRRSFSAEAQHDRNALRTESER